MKMAQMHFVLPAVLHYLKHVQSTGAKGMQSEHIFSSRPTAQIVHYLKNTTLFLQYEM